MNPEWSVQKTEKQETKINIGEIYFDKGLEDVFDKEEFLSEVQKISKEIEEYLGKNKNSAVYDFRIYSDRKEYEEYFKANFPEKYENFMENDMVFYYDEKNNKNIIAKFMKRTTLDPNDSRVKEYLEKEKIIFSELESQSRQNYKSNIYPTIAHELMHSHSFFRGVDYRVPGNKWAQEMVCVFVDQKMWERYIPNFRKIIEVKAREQVQNKDLHNEIINDFKEGDFQIEDWERLFYQFLESRYGKEKLINFWNVLSESKYRDNFEKCFEIIFEEKLKDAASLFQREIVED